MVTAADVVAEARDWKDTPFVWQASLKGVGADCKGLIWGVARELGLPEAASLYAAIANYGRVVPVPLLLKGLAATFARADDPQPGDVLLMSMGGQPCHLGFHAGDDVIHTYNNGPKRVISSRRAAVERAWPIHSAWRFPSLTDG
jgi:cell wall-associated NlpC family hydrolase